MFGPRRLWWFTVGELVSPWCWFRLWELREKLVRAEDVTVTVEKRNIIMFELFPVSLSSLKILQLHMNCNKQAAPDSCFVEMSLWNLGINCVCKPFSALGLSLPKTWRVNPRMNRCCAVGLFTHGNPATVDASVRSFLLLLPVWHLTELTSHIKCLHSCYL